MNNISKQETELKAIGLDLNLNYVNNSVIIVKGHKIVAPEECIVRAIQLKIREGELKPQDVELYDNKKRIEIRPDGMIKEKLESNFYQLSANLAFKLF
jgi:trehalose-6-phosphatase